MNLDVLPPWAALQEPLLRLVAAAVMGLLIGLDRELKGKVLGLKTNALMAIGAAGFALITMALIEELDHARDLGPIDPSRVVQGIIEGIGFIGAGAIIHSRGDVKGATTGATIWVVGAIGLACGFGLLWLAVLMTALTLLILVGLGLLHHPATDDQD